MITLNDIKKYLAEYNGPSVKIMEVCGTHTSNIFKHGIRSIISPKINLISGPGCPVCVTPASYIDKLFEYSRRENHCVLTFGDMMKVKGSKYSLAQAKAASGNVQILYSPLAAIKLAKDNPETTYIFAAVGFETTAPAYALLIDIAEKENIRNLKLLVSVKSVIPAMRYILENEKGIHAFLCPGHVSVITGSQYYEMLAEKYHKPFVISGFSGEHILASIYEIMRLLEQGGGGVKNLYKNAVSQTGNQKALNLINRYFDVYDDCWRGIGIIKNSGLKLKDEFSHYDAGFGILPTRDEAVPNCCRCADVILGRINPSQCPLFAKSCTPYSAMGPCMVSAEGACGIWYSNI